MQKLIGKVALITGADSGIGQATAIEFAKEGADVVICYHTDKQGGMHTLDEVTRLNRKGLVIQVDVSKEQEVDRLFSKAVTEFGKLDVLVNNAGVGGEGKRLFEMSTEGFDRTIRTNLYGTFFCSRSFIRCFKSKDGNRGKIINVTSVHEEIPMEEAGDYCASKGAIRNLTRTLALEVAELNINVNNVAPGMILTPMNQEAVDDEKVRNEKAQNIPMKRPGKPEEIAKVALFLASSDSDYVTGSSYFIDGGLTQLLGRGA